VLVLNSTCRSNWHWNNSYRQAGSLRILQLAGALYLFYVGVKNIGWAFRAYGGAIGNNLFNEKYEVKLSSASRFSQAFFVSSTNPKSILFLSFVFPGFIDPDRPMSLQFFELFIVLMATVFSIHFFLRRLQILAAVG
jgi:homoserine/homoserine lactone efflux protein